LRRVGEIVFGKTAACALAFAQPFALDYCDVTPEQKTTVLQLRAARSYRTRKQHAHTHAGVNTIAANHAGKTYLASRACLVLGVFSKAEHTCVTELVKSARYAATYFSCVWWCLVGMWCWSVCVASDSTLVHHPGGCSWL